ncbi:MAG: hypothetical protein FWC79_06790 [Oscillospiraceae bacterium]|nr:hypothetical protein [Oscillospiraceae bacterium]
MKNEIIYVPPQKSQSTVVFVRDTNIPENNLKSITYNAMLEILEGSNNIGLVTKEYVEDQLEKYGLIALKTEFKIEPIEFGIYINGNKFKELNNLIKIIKEHFLN